MLCRCRKNHFDVCCGQIFSPKLGKTQPLGNKVNCDIIVSQLIGQETVLMWAYSGSLSYFPMFWLMNEQVSAKEKLKIGK